MLCQTRSLVSVKKMRRLELFHRVLYLEVIVIVVMENLEQLKSHRQHLILCRARDSDDTSIHWHVYTFYYSLAQGILKVPVKWRMAM